MWIAMIMSTVFIATGIRLFMASTEDANKIMRAARLTQKELGAKVASNEIVKHQAFWANLYDEIQ